MRMNRAEKSIPVTCVQNRAISELARPVAQPRSRTRSSVGGL